MKCWRSPDGETEFALIEVPLETLREWKTKSPVVGIPCFWAQADDTYEVWPECARGKVVDAKS